MFRSRRSERWRLSFTNCDIAQKCFCVFCFMCVDMGKAVDMLGVCVFLGVFRCCSLKTTVMSLTDNTNKVIVCLCFHFNSHSWNQGHKVSFQSVYFSFSVKKKKKKSLCGLNFVCHPDFPLVTHWVLPSTINNNHCVQSCLTAIYFSLMLKSA